MLSKFTRKRTIVALVIVGSLVVAAGAFAYFTSSGSGTGSAAVGTSSAFKVTVAAATGGPLYPGSGSESLGYTVLNQGSGTQNLSATSVAVAAKNGDITQNGVEVTGCLASWFNAVDTPPAYGAIAGGGQVTGSVTVTMPNDTTDNQDHCQGTTPDITVSAS